VQSSYLDSIKVFPTDINLMHLSTAVLLARPASTAFIYKQVRGMSGTMPAAALGKEELGPILQ
jgi:hypothetical protein